MYKELERLDGAAVPAYTIEPLLEDETAIQASLRTINPAAAVFEFWDGDPGLAKYARQAYELGIATLALISPSVAQSKYRLLGSALTPTTDFMDPTQHLNPKISSYVFNDSIHTTTRSHIDIYRNSERLHATFLDWLRDHKVINTQVQVQ